MLVNEIEREQRMTQMIKNSKKQNDVESFLEFVNVVHGKFSKLDIKPKRARREARLSEIAVIEIDTKHAIGAATLHLDAVESAVTTDVEHRFATQIRRNSILKPLPLYAWVIAKKMIGRS